jgi:hypothetical protein
MLLKAPPPPPAPAWTWTGFYVGVHAGGGWSRGNLRADHLPFPLFGLNPTLAVTGLTAAERVGATRTR